MRAADSVHDAPLLVPASRAAQICGKSVRTWQASGLIPAPLRVGRSLLWRVRDLEAWVAAGCPPRDEWDARVA